MDTDKALLYIFSQDDKDYEINNTLINLGKKIKLKRKLMGINGIQLAEICGVDKRRIYDIENGKGIKLETLLSILTGLGLDINDIFRKKDV